MEKILVLVVVIIVIAAAVYYEKRRGSDMAAVAGRMGFSFEAGQHPLPSTLDNAGFDLFTQGPPNIKNRMWGNRNGREITLFDFHYDATTSGEGQRQTPVADDHNSIERRSQSVIWFRSGTTLPDFDLSPNRLHRRTVAARFGLAQVTLDGRPTFNERFTLLARDAVKVRELFNDRVLEYLNAHPRMVMESRGRDTLFYRFEQLPNPGALTQFIDEAERLLELFHK